MKAKLCRVCTGGKCKHSGTLCDHGRERRRCKECGGNLICVHGRRRTKCTDCRCVRAAADAQEKAAAALEKAAAALGAAAALEMSETAAPAPAAAPAETPECGVCTFVRFC